MRVIASQRAIRSACSWDVLCVSSAWALCHTYSSVGSCICLYWSVWTQKNALFGQIACEVWRRTRRLANTSSWVSVGHQVGRTVDYTSPCGDFGKEIWRAIVDAGHCCIVCKEVWSWRTSRYTHVGAVISKSLRLSCAVANTQTSRIISKSTIGTLSNADIIVTVIVRALRAHQHTLVSRIISVIRRKATQFTWSRGILGEVKTSTVQSAGIVSYIRVVRRWTVKHACSSYVVAVHELRSAWASRNTIVSTVVCIKGIWTKLYASAWS